MKYQEVLCISTVVKLFFFEVCLLLVLYLQPFPSFIVPGMCCPCSDTAHVPAHRRRRHVIRYGIDQ